MRAVIQRVSKASVSIEGKTTGSIDHGLMVLLAVSAYDEISDAEYLAEKIINLRIFNDGNDKLNLSLVDVKGEILSISQFTLYGNTKKGRRPSFIDSAPPEKGNRLYEIFNNAIRKFNVKVETGIFGAMMDVELINSGPVTLIIDSK